MTHKKIALFLIVFVVLCLGVFYFFNKESARHSAFTINGHNYSKTEISEMATFAAKNSGFTRVQEAKNIFELYETQVAAQKAEVVPNDNELQASGKTLHFSSVPKPADKEYVKLVTYDIALTNQTYKRYAQGDYEGDEFIFDFSQKIIPPAVGVAPLPGQGDPALIKKDKEYAMEQAKKYYSIYKGNKSLIEKLNAELQTNSKIGFLAGARSFDSKSTVSLSGQIYQTDMYTYLKAQTKPGLSGIKVGRVPTKFVRPSTHDYQDGYYYFMNLRKAHPGIEDPQKKVETERKNLQVVYRGI